jgi:hypothetical protein
MPALLNAVRELVGFDAAEFAWVDTRGEMTNLYAELLLPPDVMNFYFHRVESADHPVSVTFRTRAAQIDPVTTLSVTDALRHTELYRHVLRHLGAEHALFCVIRDRDRPLGQLSLYRGVRTVRRSAPRIAMRSAPSRGTSLMALTIRSPQGATPARIKPIGIPNSRRC